MYTDRRRRGPFRGGGADLFRGALYRKFADFIRKYGMKDMYSAGFYPFETQEEKWAYWSRHILLNRFLPPALPLYKGLFALVKDKGSLRPHDQRRRTSFIRRGSRPSASLRCRAITAKYSARRGCHDKLYDDEALVSRWTPNRKTAASPLTSCPNAPSAAAIWR